MSRFPKGSSSVDSSRASTAAEACIHFAVSLLATAAFATAITPSAHAQYDRWYQLSEQAVKLQEAGNEAAALPLEQQAEQVAEATWGPNDRHVALSSNMLGILDMDLEKFSDAETNLQRALAIDTRAGGEETKDAAGTLSNLGLLYQYEGKYPAAEKATAQAMAIYQKLLGDNNQNVATCASNLALIDLKEDKYADSETLYKKALAIDQKLGLNADVATDLGGLGSLYDEIGKYADAEQAFNQALQVNLKTLGPQHPIIGLSYFHIAEAYQFEGKFAEAEQTYGKAMEIEQKAASPDNATIALIEQNMGSLLRDEGKYQAAETLLLQVLKNRAQVLGPNHPDVALALASLGGLYEYEFRFSDAERAFRQELAIDQKSLGPGALQTARAMVDLANLYGSHGLSPQAGPLFVTAVPIYLKILGGSDKRVADVFADAGQEMLNEQKFDGAAKMFNAAGQVYQRAEGAEGVGVAKCLDRLGTIAEDEGEHDTAESLHKKALAIYEKTSGADSIAATYALQGLARIYKSQQKFADSEQLYLRVLKIDQSKLMPDDPGLLDDEADMAALYFAWDKPAQAAPYFKSYLGRLMDEFRANAATMSERERVNYFATQKGAFPMFFSFVLKYHNQMPELAGQMYDALLEEKGLIATSSASMRAAVIASGDPQAVQMLDKLAVDRAQVAALVTTTVGDPANHRAQLDQVATEANTLEQSLMKRSAAFSQQKTVNAATWRDVQKALKPGEAAVEFARFQFNGGYGPTAHVAYVALVVTPDCKEPAIFLLGEAKDLEATPLLAFRGGVAQSRGFEAEPAPAAGGQQGTVANTSAAYASFWKPLESTLATTKRVYVSPDGVLNTIPIGVMADADGKLLLEKVQLRIVNSTKELLLPARVAQTKSALVVGNPKFDLTAVEQRTAIATLRGGATGSGPAAQNTQHVTVPTKSAAQFASGFGDLKGGDLNPLPGTQIEVDTVNKLLKTAGWQTTEYTGELALKDTITQARGPRLVHIATHGFFLSDEEMTAQAEARGIKANLGEDPMLRSGLFFAGADRVRQGTAPEQGVDDGVLTAFEASQLNLEGTELVVLSACETGLGKEMVGDGVFGLRRGLEEAGADAVLMSMWSVPDKETQELMALFYAKWLAGTDKAEALRQAQLAERETVRQRYGKDLPYYWGAFVLVGR